MQTKALLILNYLDEIEKSKKDFLALKRAFLSSGMAEPSKIFPEAFPESDKKEIEETDPADDDDVIFDYSGVTWKSGSEAYGEYQRLMEQVGVAQNGSMNGQEISVTEWTEWG